MERLTTLDSLLAEVPTSVLYARSVGHKGHTQQNSISANRMTRLLCQIDIPFLQNIEVSGKETLAVINQMQAEGVIGK